jgi:RNA polymerase sigma factor (sigma-70 family)
MSDAVRRHGSALQGPRAAPGPAAGDHDQRIADVVTREGPRLRNFIRRQVADPFDAEDILQDVFFTLVEANRLLMPIEHITGWLYRVARNRIVDLFRRRKPEEPPQLDELLSPAGEGPDARYARSVLLDALEAALAELPKEQRDVFLAHEIHGYTFKEIADRTGVNLNTLLARKRYAVRFLRRRLQPILDDIDPRS